MENWMIFRLSLSFFSLYHTHTLFATPTLTQSPIHLPVGARISNWRGKGHSLPPSFVRQPTLWRKSYAKNITHLRTRSDLRKVLSGSNFAGQPIKSLPPSFRGSSFSCNKKDNFPNGTIAPNLFSNGEKLLFVLSHFHLLVITYIPNNDTGLHCWVWTSASR